MKINMCSCRHTNIFKRVGLDCPTWILMLLFFGLGTYLGATEKQRPVDLVQPLVDSANSRWFFFNSASRPFGMVNLSPDMIIDGAWNSGYRYNVDRIRAFSHVHAWQLSGIPVLPTTGEFKGHLGSDEYGSKYTHDDETVEVGYHEVMLQDYGITAELTSTTRVGLHRYSFPESEKSYILFDFSTPLGPSDTGPASVRMVSHSEIEGVVEMAPTRRRPKPVSIYFVAQLDQPANRVCGWKDQKPVGEITKIEGEDIGVYFEFSSTDGEQRMMKVAISYVSIANARQNLLAELGHWDFDKIVQESKDQWNGLLSRIEVEGGSLLDQQRFYTDLWHALQGRRIVSDVNGEYSDRTGPSPRIGKIPMAPGDERKPLFNMFNSDSFWGAQWTIQTLWQLVYPEIAEDFVNSLVQMYKDGGLIPRGPSGGNYTYVMTGSSATPFIVGAYQKGIRGFDVESAYEGLVKNHSIDGIMAKAGYEHDTALGGGMDHYIRMGYVPYPLPEEASNDGFHQDGSGQTLEYAFQDWTLSQLAMALGETKDAKRFKKRSRNYRNLWNDELGWMWNRNIEGDWTQPIDLLEYHNGWVESNAVQATWFVPHDLQGLAELIGGNQATVEKLNASFEKAKFHGFVSSKSQDKEKTRENRRVFINYGNQPSMQTAMIFNHVGAPWLTQYWSRQVIQEVYSGVSPHYGYSGDEDQGLMGALAVLMKCGIFSMTGGSEVEPILEFSTPLFEKVNIRLNPDYYEGDSFEIVAEGADRGDFYIQSATLNGFSQNSPFVSHRTVTSGGRLVLTVGNRANKNWGTAHE